MENKNKMLIDATHPEETRVVVLKNGRVEEFDYESAARKLLRGNIYLAKVTRVEPSLQAAFIDYGGNRHGFLAFSEIHPDYYQIPFADRQALLDEEAEEEARAEQEADARAERRSRGGRSDRGSRDEAFEIDEVSDVGAAERPDDHGSVEGDVSAGSAPEASDAGGSARSTYAAPAVRGESAEWVEHGRGAGTGNEVPLEHAQAAAHEFEVPAQRSGDPAGDADDPRPRGLVEDEGVIEVDDNGNGGGLPPEAIEPVGSEDALEEVPERTRRRARQYKIQEVIKRRQIILVQVVKEERGSKGAALTTYLSLAGRYTVLMPNTARGGGISRKITNAQDRKRLKAIANELEVPEGMGLIIRTAGAARTKQEIRRDFEYLLRLWESVREVTLSSTAPCLVYEEGNLIKRSLRDLYSRDIDQVLVAGREAYREAHDFMGMLMPSSVESVIDYAEPEPLFNRYQIERQLNAMFSPFVTLRSGGYLVINQTEALVAIDINSGKSTREFSIEETALSTNLEAADEIARQLKLRDLAGLIVIDFIDMEEKRNNRNVERRLKDALRHDRARIQIGHISHFGLLEMSRQRLRTGVLEGSTTQCPHCQGTGIIRSTESVALAVLRGIEDHLMKGPVSSISVLTTSNVALYILNQKRQFIAEIEQRYEISVAIQASEKMQGASFSIERTSEPVVAASRRPPKAAVSMEWGFEGVEEDEDEPEERAVEEPREERAEPREESGDEGTEPRSRSRRRKRSRGRRDDRGREADARPDGGAGQQPVTAIRSVDTVEPEDDEDRQDGTADVADGGDDDEQGPSVEGQAGDAPRSSSRRRRRGRRGGRSRGREGERGEMGVATGSPADPAADQPDIDPENLPPGRWAGTPIPARRDGERPLAEQSASAMGEPKQISDLGFGGPHTPIEVSPGQMIVADVPVDVEPREAPRSTHDDWQPARVQPDPEPAPARVAVERYVPHEQHPPQSPEPATERPLVLARSVPVIEPPAAVQGERFAMAGERSEQAERPAEATRASEQTEAPATPPQSESADPPRKGWWQRRFGG